MAGDYTRRTFDPVKNFAAVLMQQGRVQLDADWNELAELLDRRWRAETQDIIGRAVVPAVTTRDAFKIGPDPVVNDLTIEPGRMYVDGLLAENHGAPPMVMDPALGEEHGSNPRTYRKQPYLFIRESDSLPAGKYLVYLDVWEREVTALQDADLVEKAVGVDTATRLQTVWQVRVLANIGDAVTRETPETAIPGWLELIRPSEGRLTTSFQPPAQEDSQCIVPVVDGYSGVENRLYRVEIDTGGTADQATFRWSRENASVATRVTEINGTTLTVANIGRDSTLRFSSQDWVEVIDDRLELRGCCGNICQIDHVEDATQQIFLKQALTGEFDANDASRHTRVRRWEEAEQPVNLGNPVLLEHGVYVTFSLAAEDGLFRKGDWWCFPVRTCDNSAGPLTDAPPYGIYHHYARLAIVDSDGHVQDCREHWPPEAGSGGCRSTFCVNPEDHKTGKFTIQQAIDEAKKSNGGVVCLEPGIYVLREPLKVQGANSVRLHGQGWGTMLLYSGPEQAMAIEHCLEIRVEDITIVSYGEQQRAAGMRRAANRAVVTQGGHGITLSDCIGVAIQRCVLLTFGGTAIQLLDGFLVGVLLRENLIVGPAGIVSLHDPESPNQLKLLLTMSLLIEDNVVSCTMQGIALSGLAFHNGETRIAGNTIGGCRLGGIVCTGAVLGTQFPGSRLEVRENVVRAEQDGIVIGVSAARVEANDIGPDLAGRGTDGIVLETGLDPAGPDHCQVLSNRVTAMGGDGIALRGRVRSAMIKQNIIEGVAGSGLMVQDGGQADWLAIENNHFLNLSPHTNETDANARLVLSGIHLSTVRHADIVGNVVCGVARRASKPAFVFGLYLGTVSSARVSGNTVTEIGPERGFDGESCGVQVVPPFDRVDICENTIGRPRPNAPYEGPSMGIALRVGTAYGGAASTTPRGLDYAVYAADYLLMMVQNGEQTASIRGNSLETAGAAPAVIVRAGDCIFTDNHCLLSEAGNVDAITISAIRLLISSNCARGAAAVKMRLTVTDTFRVLGNLITGGIWVGGNVLGPPWDKFN